MAGNLNVVIVPDEGGKARRFNIPVLWLKIAAGVGGVLVIGLIIGIVSYARFAHKALDWDRLSKENERLSKENQRIVQVAKELEKSRVILKRIVKTLGGKLDMQDSPIQEDKPEETPGRRDQEQQ